MDLRQLRYFVEIAHLKSLTAASARIYVAQSALSRQIKLLEEELGVSLLVREARGVRLTEAGEALLARAQVLLRDAENIKAELRSGAGEPSGRLQLCAPPSLRNMLVAPFAARFAQRFPKVTLGLREGTSRQMRDALARGEADLALVSSEEEVSPFATRALLTEPLCWVGPPQSKISIDKPVPVTRLVGNPLILTPYPNSLRVLVDRALASHGLQVAPVAEADMVAMKLDLIRRGMGYTVLPLSALDEQLRQRNIRAARVRGLQISWVAAWSSERGQSPAVREALSLIEALVEEKIGSGAWPYAKRAVASAAV